MAALRQENTAIAKFFLLFYYKCMAIIKKALTFYRQTAALLMVFAFLTTALFYIVFGPRDVGETPKQIAQIAQSEIELSQDNPGPVVIEQDLLAGVEAGGCDSTSAGLTTEEKSLIEMINNYRQRNGLSALEISGLLNNMAANLAEDMNTHNYLGHVDYQGRDLATRFSDCVPNLGGPGYENAAMAPTAQQVFNGWKASPDHNDNMLSSDSRAMGIANSGNYWANDFTSNNPGGDVIDDNTAPAATQRPPIATPTTIPTIPNNQTSFPKPKVLIIGYYPKDPNNPNNLDPNETGENITAQEKENYVNGLVNTMLAEATESTRYHGYKDSSAPSYISYSIADTKNFYTKIPRGNILWAERGIYRPDYRQILDGVNICDYINNKGVKEVWMFGYHHGEIEPDESRMSGKYGDISNSIPRETDPNYLPQYRMPKCNHSYVLYNFNYQRSVAEMLHNRLHQLENIFEYIASSIFWNDFSEYIQAEGACPIINSQRICHEIHDYRSSCGNAHYTPNWRRSGNNTSLNPLLSDNYNYQIQDYRENNCETWHPDDSQTTYANANCSQWGCTEIGFYKWFLQNIPGYNNCIVYNGQKMRNWWDAMYDFDFFVDKGRTLYSDEQNCQLQIPISFDSKIALNLALPGFGLNQALGQNSNPIVRVLNADIDIFDLQNQKVKNIPGSVTFDSISQSFRGEISVGSLTGSYVIKAKLDNTLWRRTPGIITLVSSQKSETQQTQLVSGDLNQDNELSLADYNILLSCYGRKSCEQKSSTDLNIDGLIDEKDINIFYSGLAKRIGN